MNPYAAPRAPVHDDIAPQRAAGLLHHARRVPAARGASWYRDAWRLYTVAPGAWIAIALLFLIVFTALAFVPWIGPFLDGLVLPLLIGGAMRAARQAEHERDVRVGELFAAIRTHARPLLLIGVPWMAINFVLFVVLTGLTALYVGLPVGVEILSEDFTGELIDKGGWPTFIAMNAGFFIVSMPVDVVMWLAAALVTLNDVPARRALGMASAGALRNVPAVLVYMLAGMVLAVLATLPGLLGWLVLGPLLVITSYAQYRDLFVATEPGSA